jgi:hypothetical protein
LVFLGGAEAPEGFFLDSVIAIAFGLLSLAFCQVAAWRRSAPPARVRLAARGLRFQPNQKQSLIGEINSA